MSETLLSLSPPPTEDMRTALNTLESLLRQPVDQRPENWIAMVGEASSDVVVPLIAYIGESNFRQLLATITGEEFDP